MEILYQAALIIIILTQVGCETDSENNDCIYSPDNNATIINFTSAAAVELTLSKIAKSCSNSVGRVIIHMDMSHTQVEQNVDFSNITAVTINGNGHVLECTPGTGILFDSVEMVAIQILTLKYCGLQQPLLVGQGYELSGLYILSSSCVELVNVTLTENNGSGLHISRGLPKNVTIVNSIFSSNKLPENDGRFLFGGNGLRLSLNYHNASDSEVNIRIENCSFSNNVDNGFIYNILLSNSSGRGRGGGIHISVYQSPQVLNIVIFNCSFDNNVAYLGAGASVSLRGYTGRSTLEIIDSKFIQNGCDQKAALGIGGGIIMSFESRHQASTGMFRIINTVFEMNCAALGGGSYFFSQKLAKYAYSRHLLFDNCTWIRNLANIGAAVLLAPRTFSRFLDGRLPVPTFRNCVFLGNSVVFYHRDTSPHQYRSGTLYSSLLSLKFENTTNFENNLGSGIVIINAQLDFRDSNITFINNTAVQGGAVSLIGVSAMLIGDNEEYRFERNRAFDKGGAIFVQLVDSADVLSSRSCFLQYKSDTNSIIRSKLWKSSLIFVNNTAGNTGHSIFATSLIPCQVVSSITGMNRYEVLEVSEIFVSPGIQIFSERMDLEISTEGVEFDATHHTLSLLPGIQKELDVRVLDDLNQKINPNLVASLPPNSSLQVSSIFSDGAKYHVKLNGAEGMNDKLTIQTLGTVQLRHTFNVTIQKCPPGFRFGSSSSCVCESDSYIGISRCENNVAYLAEGFWAGYIHTEGNRNTLATSVCPVGFCNYETVSNRELKLPSNPHLLEEAICGESRRGILCGTCNIGYTAYYHSPGLSCRKEEPVSCKLGWLFYFLSEILPVTLVFGFVLLFNVNFTSGDLNGFILFSQLQRTLHFDASGIITYSPVIQHFTQAYQVIYGIFNLDYFNIEPLSYCIWKNASVLEMIFFKYLTITYSFFLVLSVILFMRYCAARCLGRYYSISALRNSIIHGISGFLVLCYSQTITVSFNILHSLTLSISLNKTMVINKLTRVRLSGDYESFGRGHLPYAVPALVVILTVGCVPPILLLCYPQINKTLTHFKLNKVWGLRKLEHLHTFKPLFDSFQGSFKDNYRCFAGLYFLYRWAGLIVSSYSRSFSEFYIAVQVAILVMLVLHCICQPYQKRWHNVLDTFIFAVLVFAIGLSNLNHYLVRVDSRKYNSTNLSSVFQLILIYMPICYLVIYCTVWLLRKLFCTTATTDAQSSTPEEFALNKISNKIKHLSLLSSTTAADEEDELPYRVLGYKEDKSFVDSTVDMQEEMQPTY